MLDTKVVKILPNFAQATGPFLVEKVMNIVKFGVVRGYFYFE